MEKLDSKKGERQLYQQNIDSIRKSELVDVSGYGKVKTINNFQTRGVLKKKGSSSSCTSNLSGSSRAEFSEIKFRNEELEALGIEEGEYSEESLNEE